MYIGWAPFHVSGSAGLNLSGVGCIYEDWVACIRVGLPLLGDGCIYQEWVACMRVGLHGSGLSCIYHGWVACIRVGLPLSGMVCMYQGWVAWIWFEVYILANLIQKQRLKCMYLSKDTGSKIFVVH